MTGDLLAAGEIVDPFFGENERDLQWIGEREWTCSRTFEVSGELAAEERILLQCDGLDTLGTVYLNDQRVAQTDNMHRHYEWDVKPLLIAGENKICVVFASPNAYSRERYAQRSCF